MGPSGHALPLSLGQGSRGAPQSGLRPWPGAVRSFQGASRSFRDASQSARAPGIERVNLVGITTSARIAPPRGSHLADRAGEPPL